MAGDRDRHLGADSSIFQQHAGPDSRVAGHKAPVATDLSSMQQRAGVQVGEDAEECRTHLEDLWADDLVGAGGAAPLCPGAPPTAALWPCCRHQRCQISGGVGGWVLGKGERGLCLEGSRNLGERRGASGFHSSGLCSSRSAKEQVVFPSEDSLSELLHHNRS